jgi:signal transduction histidine kinase/DNA-binding response OmpR family regulator
MSKPSLEMKMSFEQLRRVRLINLFCLLAALSTVPYIFIFSGELSFLSPISSGALLIFLLCILLNKRYHNLARLLLLISSNLYIFITASTFGRQTAEQIIYLPILFGAVLVFDFTEKKSLIFSILFTLVCVVTLEMTNYSLLHVTISPEEQLNYYYGNIIITFACSIVIALFYFFLYDKQNVHNERIIQNASEAEKIVNYFAVSLYGKNTEGEILWDVAKNCIGSLGFEDCVIYMLDKNNTLIQKAAYGPKNLVAHEITNAIEIPYGQGIVGHVAKTGIAEIIDDTSKDPRYIVDDEMRLSEITVPILYQNKVIGVIDAEHRQKNFFTYHHLNILNTIASLCSNKIIKARAEEEKINATLTRLEAEKIRELDKVKSKFFVNISHEFRTPLTLILGPLDEMIKNETDEVELKQLKMMQNSARKLLRLINDLLELAKLDEGMLSLETAMEDVFAFVRTTAHSFESLAHQRNIDFQIQAPRYSLTIEFDVIKVETILVNLLSNAFKFTPSGGKVLTKVAMKDEYIEIMVMNTGREIAPDHLDKIFDRFYQSDQQLSESSGIGLALAKELAELHGGRLTVESNKENGNSFTLSIPLERSAAREPERLNSKNNDIEQIKAARLKQNPFGPNGKKPVALIVEDNDDLRNYLIRVMASEFSLLEAVNGEEGCRLAMENVPDLVISDVMMPVMDGLQLCKNLKSSEITSHIPIIILTARADMESKLEGLEIGADYYLAKPFQAKELFTVSNNLVTQRNKLKEQFSKTVLLKSDTWEGSSADERFLQKLMSVVEANIADPDLSVEHLQKEMGISRMQLHRKLKALTDLSATEFIRSVRLKRAAEMLERGQDNVSQIAYQVGFNSLSYFAKCFKEQYGEIPSLYSVKKDISEQ